MIDDYRSKKGCIFDIQRYSIHDGPGIRTIVFLKGCGLRCRWCCNPESQSLDIQTMRVDDKVKVVGRNVTAEQVMEDVLRDAPYYRRSGGGLTLSGGEALLQPDFSNALLRMAKASGLSTAMESTGYGPFDTIREKILPWLDVMLMDIKHMDGEKHQAFTGKSNHPMLENARHIAEDGRSTLIVRVPVVPGFNDTEGEIADIARFAASLPGVHRLHLLPFHQYGAHKYAQLGRIYGMERVKPLSAERMDTLLQAGSPFGLTVQSGG